MFADIIAVGLVALTIYLWRNRSAQAKLSKGFPLPPGPSRKPLVGNLFDVPRSKNWHKFLEWKEQYGDLVYVEALGNRILIVNTLEAVSDLFESRHAIYSDRPGFTMVGELMRLNKSMPLLQYGEEWKRQRKFTHMALSPEAVKKYDSVGDFAAKYIDTLLENPDDFERQLRLTVGRIIMAVTYGLPVDTPDDLLSSLILFQDVRRHPRCIVELTLISYLPVKYLPAWIPFNHIHATAASGRADIEGLVTRPYEHVKMERKQGTNQPSFTAECLEKYQSDDPNVQAAVEHTLRWAAGSMYGGEYQPPSSYSTTLNFILALAMYPDVQAKLKEELSRVVGTDRLPTLQDRDALPYLQATIKEAMRWRPALPLSIARATRSADFYKGRWLMHSLHNVLRLSKCNHVGYYIPEGTIVLPNVWAMTKDDKSGFPSDEFVPERHLSDEVKRIATDPYAYAFGFGRRICPGKYLGDNMVFMLFSNIVATVDISKKKDANGNEIPLMPSYSDGLVSYPRSFEVDIKPTSKAAISNVKERVSQFA
ncbi:cytochrome P450 [Lanmaoa asiatica]|nr:cytochrome P450 [Lanmaoa asiatica]